MSCAGHQEESDNSHAANIRRLANELNSAILAAVHDGLSVGFTTVETKGPLTTHRTIDDWQFDRAKLGRLIENR